MFLSGHFQNDLSMFNRPEKRMTLMDYKRLVSEYLTIYFSLSVVEDLRVLLGRSLSSCLGSSHFLAHGGGGGNGGDRVKIID